MTTREASLMKRCRSEHGYHMKELSLEKSQIHGQYHFGVVGNVLYSVREQMTIKRLAAILYIPAGGRQTGEEVHGLQEESKTQCTCYC